MSKNQKAQKNASGRTVRQAFISYCHADNEDTDRSWATWLLHELEKYTIPPELVGVRNTYGEKIPEHLYPIFKDDMSLPATTQLTKSIQVELNNSRFLIVICSPRATRSESVSSEISYFIKQRPKNVIAVVIYGQPNTPNSAVDPEDARTMECLPEPLKKIYRTQNSDEKLVESDLLTLDFRIEDRGKGFTSLGAYEQFLVDKGFSKKKSRIITEKYSLQRDNNLLKIVAAIIGVSLEELTTRDKDYRLQKAEVEAIKDKNINRVLILLLSLTVLGIVATVVQYNEANKQKQQAIQQSRLAYKNLDDALFGYFGLAELQGETGDILHAHETFSYAIYLAESIPPETGPREAEVWGILADQLMYFADTLRKHRLFEPAEDTYKKAKEIVERLLTLTIVNESDKIWEPYLYWKTMDIGTRQGLNLIRIDTDAPSRTDILRNQVEQIERSIRHSKSKLELFGERFGEYDVRDHEYKLHRIEVAHGKPVPITNNTIEINAISPTLIGEDMVWYFAGRIKRPGDYTITITTSLDPLYSAKIHVSGTEDFGEIIWDDEKISNFWVYRVGDSWAKVTLEIVNITTGHSDTVNQWVRFTAAEKLLLTVGLRKNVAKISDLSKINIRKTK